MIRRICAAQIGEFARVVDQEVLFIELLPVYKQLLSDDNDTCRAICLESLIQIVSCLSREQNSVHTIAIVISAAEDRSWRVRLCLAKNFDKFSEAFGSQITESTLITKLELLLNDSEEEVKNAAVTSMNKILNTLSADKITNVIFPTLEANFVKPSFDFKIAFCQTIGEIATLVGREFF